MWEYIVSTSSGGGSVPASSAIRRDTSDLGKPRSTIRTKWRTRVMSPRIFDNGWVRRSSTSLYVPTTRSLLSAPSWERNSSSLSEGSSDQWRSSSTITIGASRVARVRNRLIESKSLNRSSSRPPNSGGSSISPRYSSMSGTMRAITPAESPNNSRRRSGSVDLINERITCTHGQYGGAPDSSCILPQSAFAPFASAYAVSSSAILVLPIPGSPAIMTRRP